MKIVEGKDSQQLDTRIRFNSLEERRAAFRLLAAVHQKLIGLQRDKEYLLRLEDVCFIVSSDKRAFLHIVQGRCGSILQLYRMGEQLNDDLIRINKATIINMKHVASMHADPGPRIRVYLDTGHQHIVTGTYVKAFKQKLKGEQWHV